MAEDSRVGGSGLAPVPKEIADSQKRNSGTGEGHEPTSGVFLLAVLKKSHVIPLR